MPQIKQSAKRWRQSVKRAAANKKVKDGIDYLFRQFKKAITGADKAKSEELAKQLNKAIDKACQKRVFKKNKAARKKSRMMKKMNSLGKKTGKE